MFWHWYWWLIKCQCLCYCRQEMVDTANYRHLVPGVSVIKGLHLYEFAPKGRDFVFVVCVREGAYYRGFFRGNVWEFCWYVGNCPYWRGVRISEVSVWRGSTVLIFFFIYFFIYFMGIINTDGKRKKGRQGANRNYILIRGRRHTVFNFSALNVNWTYGGKGVRWWTLVGGIFG